MSETLTIDADAVRAVANALGQLDSQLKNDAGQLAGQVSTLDAAVQYADIGANTQLRQAINSLDQVSSLLQTAQTRLLQVVNDTLHMEQDIAGGTGGPGGAPPGGDSSGWSGWQPNKFSYGFGYSQGAKGTFTRKTQQNLSTDETETKTKVGATLFGVNYAAETDTWGDPSNSPGTYGDVQAKLGQVQAGAQVQLGWENPEKWEAGVFANATSASISANGRLGSQNWGLTGSATASGPGVNVFAGLKKGEFGADVGVTVASVQGSTGVNIAGENVGVDGSIGLQWNMGFEVGKDTEVKLGFISFGFHF